MPNEILKLVADNPALAGALKEVLLKQFDMATDTDKVDDTQLGQMLRARLVGKEKIEDAFREIGKYQSFKEPKRTENPAR